LPHVMILRQSWSILPPALAWGTKTSSAKAATNSLRLWASSAVARRCVQSEGERIRRRPESSVLLSQSALGCNRTTAIVSGCLRKVLRPRYLTDEPPRARVCIRANSPNRFALPCEGSLEATHRMC
jgi:hypothetical protein